jgi:hypothetical protein
MPRVRLALAIAALTACQVKPAGPDDTATSATGMAESGTASPTATTGAPPPPVPCGDTTCPPGELCVVPAKVCELSDETGDDEPGPPPFCAAKPTLPCDDPNNLAECLGDLLCGHTACVANSHWLMDGVLECGTAWCHCP